RKQVEGLKNETDLPITDRGELVVVHVCDVAAIEFVTPGCRRIETAEHVHQRRLATTARTHHGKIFVAPNLERDAAQRAHDLFSHYIIFGDVLNVDDHWASWPDRISIHAPEDSRFKFQGSASSLLPEPEHLFCRFLIATHLPTFF